MSDLLVMLRDIVLNFLTYGVLAQLVIMAVSELAGDRIRFKTRFYKKKAAKWLRNARIELVAIFKPINLRLTNTVDEEIANVQHALLKMGTKSARSGSSITFRLSHDATEATGEVSFAFETPDRVDNIQVSLRFPVQYQRFGDDFIDLISVTRSLQDAIRGAYPSVVSFDEIVQCQGLNKAYELNGVLREHELETLRSRRKDGIELNLADREVTVFGKMNAALKNLVLDLITYYY